MDNEAKRYYIKDNVLVVSEAMQLLNVSRQMVREYVKKGDLIPAKETPNGMLFLKNDILELSKSEYYNQVQKSLFRKTEIIGDGVTRISLRHFQENVKDVKEINSFRIYFREYDALLDNYFTLESDYVENQLINVRSPLFVVGFFDGNELWMNGCNCGYVGEGPRGSEEILQKAGVEQSEIDKLFLYNKISYFKEDNKWQIETYNQKHIEIENRLSGKISDYSGMFYFFNGHLVLLENPNYNVYRDGNNSQFLEKYIDFIPQPISIIVLSREEAMQSGHYNWNFGNPIYYQVILKDRSGRELWFQRYIDEKVSISNQKSIQEILGGIGFDFKSSKKSLSEQIKSWINYKPRMEKVITINLEEK